VRLKPVILGLFISVALGLLPVIISCSVSTALLAERVKFPAGILITWSLPTLLEHQVRTHAPSGIASQLTLHMASFGDGASFGVAAQAHPQICYKKGPTVHYWVPTYASSRKESIAPGGTNELILSLSHQPLHAKKVYFEDQTLSYTSNHWLHAARPCSRTEVAACQRLESDMSSVHELANAC
jgi:hypothetical protein